MDMFKWDILNNFHTNFPLWVDDGAHLSIRVCECKRGPNSFHRN